MQVIVKSDYCSMVPGACNACTGCGNLCIADCNGCIACGIELPAYNNEVKDNGILILRKLIDQIDHDIGSLSGDN